MLKHLLLGLAALTAINVAYAAPTYSFVATYDPLILKPRPRFAN